MNEGPSECQETGDEVRSLELIKCEFQEVVLGILFRDNMQMPLYS